MISTKYKALKKIGVGVEGGGDVEHQSGGFGYQYEETPEDDSEYMPYSINSQKGFERKTKMKKSNSWREMLKVARGIEYVSGGYSYTDESTPKEDSFYLPESIAEESKDTSEDAEDNHEEEQQSENIANDGRARKKQNYNVGTMENAQIGNQ